MKVCEVCGDEIDTRDGENRCNKASCQNAPEVIEDTRPTFGIGPDTRMTVGAVLQNKKKRKPRRRVSMADVAESLGLTRVRGALGGVYYE